MRAVGKINAKVILQRLLFGYVKLYLGFYDFGGSHIRYLELSDQIASNSLYNRCSHRKS